MSMDRYGQSINNEFEKRSIYPQESLHSISFKIDTSNVFDSKRETREREQKQSTSDIHRLTAMIGLSWKMPIRATYLIIYI